MSIADNYMPADLNAAERATWRMYFNSVFNDTRSIVKAICASTGMLARQRTGMSVKSLVAGSDFLAGWAIKFGSQNVKDRSDPPTFFSRRTNLYLEQYPTIPALWFHTGEVIGTRAAYEVHRYGVWASIKLGNTRRKQTLIERARRGELGYSTGSVMHIVEQGFNKQTGEILAWPWVEISVCPMIEVAEYGLGALVVDTESMPAKEDRILENSIKRSVERLGVKP